PFAVSAHTLIRGKVIDSVTGSPLPGATVTVKGSVTGTTTDQAGNFTLRSDSVIHTLLVSYVGYKSKLVTIDEPAEYIVIDLEPTEVRISQVSVTKLRMNPLKPLATVDVDMRPVNTSQDELRIVPGLFIAQHAGGGKAEQIFLRGFDMDHGTDIAIGVDGLPVNMVSHAHGQGYADLHFLIPELIKNIDFGKGPYDAAHGNLATGGYVDFQTFRSLDHNRIQLDIGDFNTKRLVTMTNLLGDYGKTHNQNAYLASEFYLTDGPFESSQQFKRYNLFGKYSNYVDPNHLLTVELSTFKSTWDASGQIPERAVEQGLIRRFGAIDNTEGGETARKNMLIRLNTTFRNGAGLENLLYMSDYDFTLYSDFTFFLHDPVHGDQIRQKEKRNLYGYSVKFNKEHHLGTWKGNMTAGGTYRYDAVRNQELSHTWKRLTTLDTINFGDIDELNAGMYVSENLSKGGFMLNIGGRFDFFRFEYVDKLSPVYQHQSVTKNLFSPKLSITQNLTRNWQAYLRTGVGFHTNDARDVIAESGDKILPRMYGVDLGTIWKPVDNLMIQSALWWSLMDQEFVFSGDEGTVEATGRSQRTGMDLSVRYQLNRWLIADMDMNYAVPRYVDEPRGQNYIPLAPVLSGVGGIQVKLKNGFGGSLRYRYMAPRPANEDYTVTALGYTVFDATLHYRKPAYELALLVENLFNTDWNEAQFDTESRLPFETRPVSELHFTPGTPFFLKARIAWFF
ncbi:MAG: TonB-dependent receptor, partial [Chlorobi bacterium]|nr:TonB-dependent receptor [Chlorobiota bacterium]